MALSKLRSESIDLTDDYAFTGTVTGAGSNSGFKFIKKLTISSISGSFDATDLFSADYNHYKLIWEIDNSVDDVNTNFGLIKASDGTLDTGANIDYASHGIDPDGSGRNYYANNKPYFQVESADDANVHKHFMEMNVFDPFNAEKTNFAGFGVYTINANSDTVSYNFAAMSQVTTSYSGINIYASTAIGGAVNTSNVITGRVMVYGIAES
jgi:hypothetical protein